MRGGRVVTNARRDAVDAEDVARRAAFYLRTAKPCGPGAPMQVPSLSNPNERGDGDNKARSHRGDHGISRKTIAQGMPECFGEPVVTNSCAFFHCMRGCGCITHPAFPAPSSFEGQRFVQHSGTIGVTGMRSYVLKAV